jgi:glycosyltransferase involved in cell wall biosynthesis
MRILVVTHNYPRFPGDPAGAYVARLARAAAEGGAEVRIVAPHTAGTPEREQVSGVQVNRFRYAPVPLERIGYRGDVRARAFLSPLRLLVLPSYLMAFARCVRRSLQEASVDLIHAHWWFPGGWVASKTGTPYLVTCHGSDIRLLDNSRLFRRLAARVLGEAAGVTTVSRFLAGDLERHVPVLRGRITVAPMPLDVERFAAGMETPKVQPPRILFAGNLVTGKGVDVLVRAVALLRRDRALPCGLRVLGEGPMRRTLEELARALGIADAVEWSDFVPQDAMPAEYGASTVTVLPTRGQAEGLGLTLVEALLSGCAVIGTPAGGIPEVVQDGETGFIARDGDPQDLAEKIARLLGDPALRERLTATGRARVLDTYSAQSAARRFLTLYDAVAGHHAAR